MNSKEGHRCDIEEAPQKIQMKIEEVKLKIHDLKNVVLLQHDIKSICFGGHTSSKV